MDEDLKTIYKLMMGLGIKKWMERTKELNCHRFISRGLVLSSNNTLNPATREYFPSLWKSIVQKNIRFTTYENN